MMMKYNGGDGEDGDGNDEDDDVLNKRLIDAFLNLIREN